MKQDRSITLFEEATKYIPGGVNSPVRAFNSVGMSPIFAASGKGAVLRDEDDNDYIDYVCSWGPLILGHQSKVAQEGVMEVLEQGMTFGMPTKIEVELAKEVVNAYEAIEKVRMVSSGTEATMSAIRLARGYTGRNKIIKFEGCYHGHSDGLLVKSGSGTLTNGIPTSEGVPLSIINETLVAKFNDLEDVRRLVEENLEDIATIIIEPIPGNMGLVEAKEGFLEGLRNICDQAGILLIFDEVISGFRIGYSGAAGLYGIKPDLICLGKIIGGGMPVGAYGGRKDIMDKIAPLGGVYQAGTLSGNPLAMKMGLNVVTYLKNHKEIYSDLEDKAKKIQKGFNDNLMNLEIEKVSINRIGGMVCQFFTQGPVDSYEIVMKSNTQQYADYFKAMLEEGVLLPPAQFECMFLSTEHKTSQIEYTIKAHYRSMKALKDKWIDL